MKRGDTYMTYRTRFSACWLLSSFLLICSLSFGQNPNEVVAELNGTKITRADLEKEQASKLLQVRYQAFMTEQQALSDLIDDRLLAMEAARQHITVAQLTEREINSKVTDPTEEQIQLIYEASNVSQPYEAVRGQVIQILRQRRLAKVREAYLQDLRAKADVFVTMAPPVANVAVDDAPRLGPADAPVQLIEFADYECPYCSKVQPSILKLHQEFGDKIAIYYKDMPLPMHPHARKAAEASRCAASQGKFWEYHNLLFTKSNLEAADLKKYAREMGMDGAKFDQCLDSGEKAAAVQKDFAQAQQLGLTGTPSFFVEQHFFSGAVDYNTLRDLVAQQLTLKKSTPQLSQK